VIDRIMRVDPDQPLSPEFWAAMFFQQLAGLVYFSLLESSEWQGTVGKIALRIRVGDAEGRRISVLRAAMRYLAKFVSVFTLGIGFLMVAFHGQKRGLHDLLAGTWVRRRTA
jgi:uncharacterized RDD family membrane protein YckC